MKDVVHNYDKVVVGSNMCAVMYAYLNQLPLFYSSFTKPERFEFFDPSFAFTNLNNINNYECNGEVINAGMRKIDLWDKMTIILGIEGLLPLSNNVSAIRIDEDILKITTKNSRLLKVKFNNLFLFDENIEGLPPIVQINNEGVIFDYLQLSTLHEYKNRLIKTEEDFVNQIWIEDRNAVVVTKTKNILDEVPDYAIKFRVLDLAKEHGIKGKQNGIYHYRKELKIPRFKKLDVKLNTRLIQKRTLNVYQEQENLTFIQPTDILESELLQQIKPNYLWNHLIQSRHINR